MINDFFTVLYIGIIILYRAIPYLLVGFPVAILVVRLFRRYGLI